MKEYIEREKARTLITNYGKGAINDNRKALDPVDDIIMLAKGVDLIPAADVVEVVRCKDCRHAFFRYNNDRYPFGVYACRKQPSGRAYKKVRGDFWCAYGEKMDGKGGDDDKPKTNCLNCKHLMFSDMYGECNLQLRIVNPSDTCEYAEPKDGNGDAE